MTSILYRISCSIEVIVFVQCQIDLTRIGERRTSTLPYASLNLQTEIQHFCLSQGTVNRSSVLL